MLGEFGKTIWTSELNRQAGIMPEFAYRGPVHFYDTTLRDGEQTVGVVLTPQQKLEIAHKLDELGVERIEAGFPRVSADDAEAIRLISHAGLKAEVWGFGRAVIADIEELARLGVRATVIETPTSDLKLKAYGFSREQAIDRATAAIRYAKEHGINVAFFTVDGTRAELDFLKRIYLATIEAGASEICVVDTIGVCGPEAVFYLVSQVRQWVGGKIPIHWHGHNDFGMATASAVAAVRAGASWIQGTINGMGERAGNADISEVALALKCVYDIPAVLDLTKAREVSETVRKLSGYELEPWKPVVGETLFMRESGAVASQFHIPEAIEPYSSELVQADRKMMLGKKSGLDSIDIKARELGLEFAEDQRAAILAAVKQRGIQKRGLLTDDEFREIVAHFRTQAKSV
jgi:isopropylmalate/homocitrate/citramalate synthase